MKRQSTFLIFPVLIAITTEFLAVSAYTKQDNALRELPHLLLLPPTFDYKPTNYYGAFLRPHPPPYNVNNRFYSSQRFPDSLDDSGPQSDIFSCAGRCDTKGHDERLPCQCNQHCIDFDDCCPDYALKCWSCEDRCNSRFDPDLPCQCSKKCSQYGSCCENYEDVCGSPDSNEAVSDADLSTLSESLLASDTNNVAGLVNVNLQGSTSFSSSRDNAPKPLLTVQAAAYQKPTIAKLLPLHNNYIADVGSKEDITPQESLEESAFLDAILATTVMKKTEQFLTEKGYITTRRRMANGSIRTNNRAFRDALYQIWFGMYPRENGTVGSSGFEHVFLGEVKDGKVSGFHNWVFLSKEEANNRLNYKGRIGSTVDLGSKGQIIKHKFDWNQTEKPITSMFVGTSPEFELALYTVCYYARPGQRCHVKLQDKNVRIQTYYMNKNGKRYVASAYPDI